MAPSSRRRVAAAPCRNEADPIVGGSVAITRALDETRLSANGCAAPSRPGAKAEASRHTVAVGDSEDFVWHGRPRRQVFAVVRIDAEWLKAGPPGDRAGQGLGGVTVQAVLPTSDDARAEAKRLNDLNGANGATYYWLATRYYPEGRSGTRAD